MNAYRITSTEYRANLPKVFVFVNGEYYGDLSYPRLRNFPQDVNYWVNATCADSDRYFNIAEVEITEKQVNELRALHKAIDENAKNIVPYTDYVPGLRLTVRRTFAVRKSTVRSMPRHVRLTTESRKSSTHSNHENPMLQRKAGEPCPHQ